VDRGLVRWLANRFTRRNRAARARRQFFALAALVCIVGSTLTAGVTAAASPTPPVEKIPAGVIPPGPTTTPPSVSKTAARDDLVIDAEPSIPDTEGLSGQDLAKALAASNLSKIRDVRH